MAVRSLFRGEARRDGHAEPDLGERHAPAEAGDGPNRPAGNGGDDCRPAVLWRACGAEFGEEPPGAVPLAAAAAVAPG